VALYPDQPEQTGLNVEFTTPTGRISYANPIEGPLAMTSVDDRGASATLTVTVATQVYDASGNLSDGGQATISVECGNILRNPLQASPKP